MRVERILAPNPGPFTGPGTNTYLLDVGGEVVVIDPGPVESTHRRAIVEAVGDRRTAAVVVTHTHPDHAPLANPLARELGCPTFGYGPGPDFDPDELLTDGAVVAVGDAELVAVHTPGHSEDHLCLRLGKILFTGDHIMGGSSVMVDDVGAYLRSLQRLQEMELSRLYPGHGPEIDRPREVISWYLAHRRQREEEILAAVTSGARTVGQVVEVVYADVDRSLWPLAARSVRAHLRKLAADGEIRYGGEEGWEAPVAPNEARGPAGDSGPRANRGP